MAKSSQTGAVGTRRRLETEPNELRHLLKICRIDHTVLAGALDGLPAVIFPTLGRQDQRELLSRNEELREARAEMACARERLWELYEKAPIGYVTVDEQALIVAANLKLTTLLGREERDLVGRGLGELVAAEDRDCYELHRQAFREGAVRRACELRLRRADGESVWAALESVAVTGPGGARQIRSSVSDISPLRHAEAELIRMRDRMLQAQGMEALGTLAVGLAHDINNVLAMVLLFGSALERRMRAEDPGKADAADIVAAALHGKELTQDLLDFSHKSPYHRELLRPTDVIARLVLLLRRMVAKRIAIEPLVDDAVAAIEGDPGQFMQMLMNLCLNAADAIPAEGTITIAASNVLPEDAEVCSLVGRTSTPYVRIEIADDGVGMDAETRQHAFEPFFTTKAMGKGTGLGLFMVHAEVEKLHGVVRIESQPHRGTSVHLLLPAPAATGATGLAGTPR